MKAEPLGAAILVVSDTRGSSEKPDLCAEAITGTLEGNHFNIVRTTIVKDEIPEIEKVLRQWSADTEIALIVTSGGTGVSPRDLTPEATRPLLTVELPGIPEAMRAESYKKTVMSVISRSVAGLIGSTLVVNLPGSPKAAVENLEAVAGSFAHIIRKAKGDPDECGS
jgi:molybdenum cofactor synthesis domain-containing protein